MHRNVLNMVHEYRVCDSTVAKIRASSTGEISTAVEYSVPKHPLVIQVSGQSKVKGCCAPLKHEKFGVAFIFGDF